MRFPTLLGGGTDIFYRHKHQQQLIQRFLAAFSLFQSTADTLQFALHFGQVTDRSFRTGFFAAVDGLSLQNGQHSLNVGQLTLQLGFFTGLKGFEFPHTLFTVRRAGFQSVQHILEADIFSLCKRQIDHLHPPSR